MIGRTHNDKKLKKGSLILVLFIVKNSGYLIGRTHNDKKLKKGSLILVLFIVKNSGYLIGRTHNDKKLKKGSLILVLFIVKNSGYLTKKKRSNFESRSSLLPVEELLVIFDVGLEMNSKWNLIRFSIFPSCVHT